MTQVFQAKEGVPFTTLPDILIQDPIRKVAYFLPAASMAEFQVTADTWSKLSPNTVTFVIPGEDMVDEIPPFVQDPANMPDVLIQFPTGSTAYFLTADQLQQFQVAQPTQHGGYGISFSIPSGMELIEELPGLVRSLLQSGER